MFRKSLVPTGLILTLALLCAACGGSYQARNVDLKPTMVDASILQKGKSGQALYRYMKPDLKADAYTKVIIDPVMVHKNGQLSDGQRKDYQKLADNAYVFLQQELSKDYPLVTEAGPGVARVQMAILDADPSHPLRNVITSLSPTGIGLNLLTLAVTGSQIGVGDITVETKITDAQTGELLSSSLDKRVGGKNPKETVDTWAGDNEALQYWARNMRYAACETRKAAGCVKP